jgi:hypothetical protein
MTITKMIGTMTLKKFLFLTMIITILTMKLGFGKTMNHLGEEAL